MKRTLLNITKRFYATPSKGHALGGDSRNDVIRRALFDAPLRPSEPSDSSIESQESVLNKAWSVYTAEVSKKQKEKLAIKYNRMVEAAEKLKELSPKLFEDSQKQWMGELFPKQMKVPTETPGNIIWEYQSQTKINRVKEEEAKRKEGLKKKDN